MICPNLNNPEVKAKFDQLLSVVPEYAYYLWDKYEGEVPAKYYNLANVLSDISELGIDVNSPTKTVDTVEKKLEDFLTNFGFTIEELDGLKEATGYSIIGATDFLEKTILVDKNKIELAYSKEAAYAIFNLLGRKNLLRKDLIASINLLPNYDSLKSKYINSKLSEYQIKELVAIDYLRNKLLDAHKEVLKTDNKAVSTDVTAKNPLDYTILKIKQWWSGIVRKYLKSYKLNQIENAFNQIANDVINNNTRLFNPAQPKAYKKLEITGKQKEINDFLVSLGVINSGSLALNRQGTLTRESLNDLDYFVPYYNKSGLFEQIAKKYPNIEYSEPYAGVMGNRSLTLSAKIGDVKIDFFLPNTLEESNKNKIVTIDGIKYHHWKNIFDAKVRIGSKKHLGDLAGFVPFTKEDGLLNIVGQRHYNFDFIQSKRSTVYNQANNESISVSPGISIYTNETILYNYAMAFFKDNNINYKENSLYLDLLTHFNNNTKKAAVAYYKTYSQNFKSFFGEIPTRDTVNPVLFGSKIENQSKPSVLLDEQGEPIVFYHGAGTRFDSFSKEYFLSGEGAMAYGAGFYTTNYKPTADNYRDTSKAAYESYKKLVKEENQELLNLIKNLKEEITEDSINQMIIGSGGPQSSENASQVRLLELLGVTETKALYIALTNPLQWKGEVSKENLAILEDEFKLKLKGKTGGEVYREIQNKLNISDKEVSARMYQRGIDGVVHNAMGGQAVGGFSHKKGERHVIFFEPVQAKSVENSGLFSTNNDNTYDPVESKPIVQQKSSSNMSNVISTSVKEGVSELFKSNPELANIGTPQQYSQYLDSIFPDSKVKDIVYHGANEPIEGDKFAVRPGATGNAIWFSGSKRYATNVMNSAPQPESLSGRKLRGDATMYSVLLNIKNPAYFYESSGAILAQSPERFLEGQIEPHRLHGNKQYDKNANDGALFHHPNSKKPKTNDSAEQVVVFEPEQIHILGNKQDIEGFKQFVSKNQAPAVRYGSNTNATPLKTSLGKEIEYKDPYVAKNRLKDFKQYEILNENNKNVGTVVVEYRGNKSVILHPKLKITGKGYGKDLYKLISSTFNVTVQEWNEGPISSSESAKAMWDSLEKEGLTTRITDDGPSYRVLNYTDNNKPAVMYSKSAIDTVTNHYLRLEANYNLVTDLLKDAEYEKLETIEEKEAYVANKVWQSEIEKLKGRDSINIVEGRIYHTDSTQVKTKSVSKYTEATAARINEKYIITGAKKMAWAYFDETGSYVIMNPTLTFATEIVQLVESVAEEEIRAEIEMMALQEALDIDQAGALEKTIQANELLIDGEVLPLNSIMLQKNLALNLALKEIDSKKYAQIFNKLVAKFPGATWSWDTNIKGAANVNLTTGEILVNPYLVNDETPWHEFSHFIIRGLRQSNPETFKALIREVERLHEESPTTSSKSYVEANYPELRGTDAFWEEVIATEVGAQAVDYSPKTGLYQTIVDFFNGILQSLGLTSPKFDTLGDIVSSLYDSNLSFEVYPTNSEVSDYMWSRVLPKDIDMFTEHLSTNPNDSNDFTPAIKQIQLIADAITDQEFARMMDTNKYFMSESVRKSESLRQAGAIFNGSKGRIKAMITKEDVAESVLDLSNYMQNMGMYFQGLIAHIDNIKNDPTIPPGKKLGDMHRAYKQALVVQRHLEEITGINLANKENPDGDYKRGVFKPDTILPIIKTAQTGGKDQIQNNPFLKNYFWLNNSLNSIITEHKNNIQEPIIQELFEYYGESAAELVDTISEDIDNFVEQLGKKSFDVTGQVNKNKTDRIYNGRTVSTVQKTGTGVATKFVVKYSDGTIQEFENFRTFRQSFDFPISVINLLNRIQDSKDDLKLRLPTKENLRNLLADTKGDMFAAMDVAMAVQNPGTQLVASYIKGMEMSYRGSLVDLRTETQTLMDDLIREEGGQFLGSIIDVKSFYKPYYQETVLYEVVDGILVKDKKILVLNTATDTVAMRNYMTELYHTIQYGMDAVGDLDPSDTSPDAVRRRSEAIQKVKQAETDLETFKEKYTERPYTDEYYTIQSRLPLEIRNKRNDIYRQMAALRESFVNGEISEEAFEILRDAQRELDDMESLYDSSGNLKQGDAYNTAKAIMDWKSAKLNNQVQKQDVDGNLVFDAQGNPVMVPAPTVVYSDLSDETRNLFTRTLQNRKTALQAVLNNPKSSDQQKQEANDQYNRWASLYTRTTFTQSFYDERTAITSEIQDLLAGNGNIDDLYGELFNLLRGKKDRNGEYMPHEISEGQRAASKQIEEKIEAIKNLKGKSTLSKDDKAKLTGLLEQLQDLQSNVNSKAYDKKVEEITSELRYKYTGQFPDLDSNSIDRLVDQGFRNSQWYKDNHIIKNRFDKDSNTTVQVMEPLFMWRVTRPNDPNYIEEEAPSFLWYSPKVNPIFQNPNHVIGDTTFKEPAKGDTFYNNKYDLLRDSQKDLLARMRSLHQKSQDGLYKRDKLGDMIPGVYKTSGQTGIDLIRGRNNPFKTWWNKTKEFFFKESRQALGDTDETYGIAEQNDAFGEPITRESRRLFVRYSRPIEDINDQSYDLMMALSQYAESAARFKTVRKFQSTILAMEEYLGANRKTKNNKTNKGVEVIGDLIDRELYGKGVNTPKNTFAKIANGLTHGLTRLAGRKSLAFNVISLFPNYFVGYKNNLADRRFYNLSYSDYLAAYKDTLGLSYEFISNIEKAGNKPLRMQIIEYFGGTQSNYAQDFAKVSDIGALKFTKFWKGVGTLRDLTEYDIAAQTTFAMLNKYSVKTNTGETIKLKDAFIIINGGLHIRPDVDLDPKVITKIRHEVSTANYRAQGVYDSIGQPTIAKYAMVRQLLFLKKWVPMHAKTEWGGSTIHYGAGVKTVGANLAMMRYLQQTFFEYGRFWEASKNLTRAERAALAKFRFNFFTYLALGNIISQLSLSLNCEDDGEADWKDYACFLTKKIANEAEGTFTLWGMNEMLFTYVQERANGVGFFEKLGWSLFGPFSVFKKYVNPDSGLYSMDPYYKYKPNSTKIDWDRTHPSQAGKPGLAILALELNGVKDAYLGLGAKSIEYQNRAFNSYMPKTYTKELRTRYKANHEGVETMKTRTENAQAKKQYKKQLKGLKQVITAYRQKGLEVPAEEYQRMEALSLNYSKILSEINLGRKPSNMFTGVKPFFVARPGLDMNEEEISEDISDNED